MTGYDQIEHASLTDVGMRRSHNQDAFGVFPAGEPEHWRDRGHVFIVADGMGAHAVGELASKLAVDNVLHAYQKHALQGPAPALQAAFREANAIIHERGRQNREFEGMGTTGSALVLCPEGAWLGHVGDSRVYRVRDGVIAQLSFDHSLLWELARKQNVAPEAIHGVPNNVIVRSLGPEPEVAIDVEGPHRIRAGDTYVLCSDGLSGQVVDHEIGSVASMLTPAEACRFLVDLSNLRGGPDNITVIVVRIKGASPGAGVLGRRPSGPPWSPWELAVLLVGVTFSVDALIMFGMGYKRLAFAAFVLALASLLVGVIRLGIQFWKARKKEPPKFKGARGKVYRETSCPIQASLLRGLAKAVDGLKQQVVDKNWEVDWDAYQAQRSLAEQHLAKSDLPESFRALCRAMRILADVVQRSRHKEEVFMPTWV